MNNIDSNTQEPSRLSYKFTKAERKGLMIEVFERIVLMVPVIYFENEDYGSVAREVSSIDTKDIRDSKNLRTRIYDMAYELEFRFSDPMKAEDLAVAGIIFAASVLKYDDADIEVRESTVQFAMRIGLLFHILSYIRDRVEITDEIVAKTYIMICNRDSGSFSRAASNE